MHRNYCNERCRAYTLLHLYRVTENGSFIWKKADNKELADALEKGKLKRKEWAFVKKHHIPGKWNQVKLM